MTPSRIRLLAVMALWALLGTACARPVPTPVEPGPPEPLHLHLALADTPGGHALAHAPWALAEGDPPEGLDLIDPEALLGRGETDGVGGLRLTEAQQQRCVQALAKQPSRVWLLYPGQTCPVRALRIQPEWSEDERLFHWLWAQGFCPSQEAFTGGFFATRESRELLDQAQKTLGARDDQQLRALVDLKRSGWVVVIGNSRGEARGVLGIIVRHRLASRFFVGMAGHSRLTHCLDRGGGGHT